ncbi:hypothetical protein TNCV_1913011 [Trichonephila clavipes]|nr:hypothetical protein TNCV_1913011 [Trichonephila clavipes]
MRHHHAGVWEREKVPRVMDGKMKSSSMATHVSRHNTFGLLKYLDLRYPDLREPGVCLSANFKWRLEITVSFFITETHPESVLEPNEIGNVIEVAVDLVRQINLEVDRDDVHELIEIHEQEQDIEELESLEPVQSEDRMMVVNLTEGLSLIKRGENGKIGDTSNVIEKGVDLEWQINFKVDRDDVQELLDSHNQELTIDELTEMHEQEQDIEELEFLDSVQSEDQMTDENSTEDHSLIKKGL